MKVRALPMCKKPVGDGAKRTLIMKLQFIRPTSADVDLPNPLLQVGSVTIGEIVALASVMVTVGMNVALYIHLSSALGARFDFIERRFELLLGKVIDIDNRLTRVEERMGRRAGSEPVKEWDSGRT